MTKNPTRVVVYDPALHLMGGGEKYACVLAEVLADAHDVTIVGSKPVSASTLEDFFGVDLSMCRIVFLPAPNLAIKLAFRLKLPAATIWRLQDVQRYWWLRRFRFDYFFPVESESLMPSPSRHGIYSVMFPNRLHGIRGKDNLLTRVAARLGVPIGLSALRGYSLWVTNSRYTKRWVERYWGAHDTRVLYPPCDNLALPHVDKKKMILHVGRFFDLGENNAHHHKRQDVLVQAFTRLDALVGDGWELHLAGAVSDSPAHLKALDDLRELASGARVVLHPNVSFSDLRRLFNEASIYWHATGYGSDPDKTPSAQEHFGITVVEAMSAGAVPVVYGTAGPAETVQDGQSGRHWRTIDQLLENTAELIRDPAALDSLRLGAVARASQFDRESFAAAVKGLHLL